MKLFKILSAVFLMLMLLLPASGNASAISFSSFRLWDFQISSSSSADDAGMNFDLFSGKVSVSDSINPETSLHQTVSSANRYTLQNLQTSTEYTSAESFIEPIEGIDMGSTAEVNIPFTTEALFEGTAKGVSVLTENLFLVDYNYDYESESYQERTLQFSFDYQSILKGFSGDEFGFFDSSLSVNISLKNDDDPNNIIVIPLFSLNDEILGKNQAITQDSGIQHFEKELTILMTDAAFYQLGISITANAYASTQGTPEPEPSAILLLGTGLLCAFIIRQKKS